MLGLISFGELFHLVTLLGFIQGLLLAVLLWRRKLVEPGLSFAVLHLATLSAVMLLPIVEEAWGAGYSWPLHATVFFLFQGLYLYVRHFQQPVHGRDWLLHLALPGILVLTASFLVYRGFQPETADAAENSLAVTLLSGTKIGVNLAYAFATLRLLQRHRKMILAVYSETSRVNLQWVTRLVYGFFGIIIGGAILYAVARFGGWPMQLANLFTYVGFVSYLYYAYLHATQQRPMIPLAPETAGVPTPEKEKYQRSSLTGEQATAIINNIRSVVERENLYRNADLTLPALSDACGAPTYHISQVLSELAGQNFYDFINGYRVEEAKRLLTDPSKRHYTVLAIAFEAGFNSKTTFNKVFKNVTGQTPTEFLLEWRKTQQ